MRFNSKSNDFRLTSIKQIVFHITIAAAWRLIWNKSNPHGLERKEDGP